MARHAPARSAEPWRRSLDLLLASSAADGRKLLAALIDGTRAIRGAFPSVPASNEATAQLPAVRCQGSSGAGADIDGRTGAVVGSRSASGVRLGISRLRITSSVCEATERRAL